MYEAGDRYTVAYR